MNWKRIAWQTGALLLAGAGAALAATSGLPVAAPIEKTVGFISTDMAYGLWGTGAAGIAYHFMSGRETHHALNYGLGAIAGGATCSLIPGMAGGLGLSAGALIQIATKVVTHPAIHRLFA